MQSPSKYGGMAAAAVLGVGLLLIGKTSAGLSVLGVVILVMAITITPTMARKAFFAAIGALICSGILAYWAASNELSGSATYHPGIRGRSVTVTRQDSPSKFREVTNITWGESGFCLVISVVGFTFYRKLDDYT
jgi:hypothetical protein